MLELNIFIILLPFIAIFFASILLYFFQNLLSKKYFLNILISLLFAVLLMIVIIYKFKAYLSFNEIFYIIFVYLGSSYIFINLIQGCVSSLQIAILKMIYNNPGIKKKRLISKYNSNHIFEQRIRRLVSADIVYKKKSSYYLKNNYILFVLNFFLSLKKIFGVKY